MKFFIWVSTLIVYTTLNVALGYATGFRLGYLGVIFLVPLAARFLCKKWDVFKIHCAAQKASVSSFEHIKNDIKQKVLDDCAAIRGKSENLKIYLKKCVKAGEITLAYSEILLKEYMIPSSKNVKAENVSIASQDDVFFCSHCGTKLSNNSHFCRSCGTKVSKNESTNKQTEETNESSSQEENF